jgi:hypothetical protein
MCKSKNSAKINILKKNTYDASIRVDKCLRNIIVFINKETTWETLASCCGHQRYPATIVARDPFGRIFEIFSDKEIPRKRRFYRKDLDGYYYIPETVKEMPK